MAADQGSFETGPILISGCPRSGTSWLHFLVASHPGTVSARETHVYDKYVGPMKAWFDQEFTLKAHDGMSALFSESDFTAQILTPIVDATFARIASRQGGSGRVVEKTPGNILHHRLVHDIQPTSRLLYVSRDPRAVFASFKAAAAQDWGGWTRKSIADFCTSWNKYAVAYLAARSYWPAERLMMVRYEDMVQAGPRQLSEIYDWAGLEQTEGQAEAALEQNDIKKLRQAKKGALQYDARKDFYRQGKAHGWVAELNMEEIREVESHCANLMLILNYKRHRP